MHALIHPGCNILGWHPPPNTKSSRSSNISALTPPKQSDKMQKRSILFCIICIDKEFESMSSGTRFLSMNNALMLGGGSWARRMNPSTTIIQFWVDKCMEAHHLGIEAHDSYYDEWYYIDNNNNNNIITQIADSFLKLFWPGNQP